MDCYYCYKPIICKCQEKDFMIEKIKDVLPLKEYNPEWDKEDHEQAERD